VTLEAADHGRAILKGALVVAVAGVLPGDAIDVFLRPLLDAVDWQLPTQVGAVGGSTVARSSGGLRPGWTVAAGSVIDADSVGSIDTAGAVVFGWLLGGLGTIVLGRLVLLELSLFCDARRSCIILMNASKAGFGCEASGREGCDENECESGGLHRDIGADRSDVQSFDFELVEPDVYFAFVSVQFFDL